MTSLTLPEEFVLMLQRENGSYYAASDHAGAAELGELVLRNRVSFTGKKVQVDDPSPTGLGWADECIAYLQQKGGPKAKPVAATSFIQHRRKVRKQHCAALVERGLMRHEQRTALLIPYDKYFPDQATRTALIDELRSIARAERELDNRSALLAALVHATGLVRHFGFERAERKRLKEISKGEELGKAVAAVIAAATAAITASTVAASSAAMGGGS
ncbi:Golgi phosphoprotein 3 (GPP34) [Saccharopolyspora kobensis]|uniref:Golgi phosphoprotein 3 (GPP34) n=1 Tax=Saccharopolyspora kobensis TaxID=146035 RepID=A0A1H6DJ63_9PSEU|nr:GPP34 family phosphoprotein [Saccharopolyspora kobensis]SEG85300.1 Golgi phosphoprotein 3 (GPP34) [Saccharopolyspora kobensis]SFD24713.1 Golgi phosphoprotein 3 (GPP34) [Saccharopolyspora kobensis]